MSVTLPQPDAGEPDTLTMSTLPSTTNRPIPGQPRGQSAVSLLSRSTSFISPRHVSKDLVPLAPSYNPRYADIKWATRLFNPSFIDEKIEAIDEGPQSSSPDPLPPQWKAYTHPEGKPYYHDKARNLATYANMRDSTMSDQVENAFQKLSATKVTLAPHHELVIEISEDGWCHYFADHKKLSIFWARKVEAPELDMEVFNSKVQRGLWLQKEYWYHLHNFPFHNDLPKGSVSELTAALLYGGVDRASSQSTMFPFTDEQKETYLSALSAFRTHDALEGEEELYKGHQNSTIARIWSSLGEARFLGQHGYDTARIDRNQRLGVMAMRDSRVLRCLQILSRVLLFNTPDAHHLHLQRVWLGQIVLSEHWQKFVEDLLTEWNTSTLLATVLLAADVSFWSVGDLHFGAGLSIWISAVFALGSVVTALLQIMRHLQWAQASALRVANHLSKFESRSLKLFPLAIIYATPNYLLIWSVIWFGVGMVAFAVQTFWESKVGKAAIILMAIMRTWPFLLTLYLP